MKVAVLSLVAVALLLATDATNANAKPQPHRVCKESRSAVKFYRSRTWFWQDHRHVSRTRTSYAERSTSCPYVRWAAKLWANRSWRERQRYKTDLRRLASDPVRAITVVFGSYASQALAVARCESGLYTGATNGQYLGLFQMGTYARSMYGHGYDAFTQARAAYSYFIDSGRDWSPWECKP